MQEAGYARLHTDTHTLTNVHTHTRIHTQTRRYKIQKPGYVRLHVHTDTHTHSFVVRNGGKSAPQNTIHAAKSARHYTRVCNQSAKQKIERRVKVGRERERERERGGWRGLRLGQLAWLL